MPRFGEREDIILGACVLAFGALLLAWVHSLDAVPKEESGMTLRASFQRTDGLNEGAAVRLAGINVGYVTDMTLNDAFRSEVVMHLEKPVPVPLDSAAVIHTEGLFGGKYIEIEPGGSLDTLRDGEQIAYTQDAMIVEDLLERLTAMAKSRNAECAEIMARDKTQDTQNSDTGAPATPSLLLPLTEGNL